MDNLFSKHAVLIGGLPGSGKSAFAEFFVKMGYFLLDDPSKHKPNLPEVMKDYEKIVVTDPFLDPSRINFAKELFEAEGFTVTPIILAESKDVCLKRAESRKDKKVEEFIKRSADKEYKFLG